jgi:hypothetical protein
MQKSANNPITSKEETYTEQSLHLVAGAAGIILVGRFF